MLVIVTGIPASGKTTVAKKAIKELANEDIEYQIVVYGTVMEDIAKAEGLVKDRDEIRRLSPNKQKEIQKKAAQKIGEMSKDNNILLDTHCTIKTPKGYLPGLPEWVLKELRPSHIVIIESLPEDIEKRRGRDKGRRRDEEDSRELIRHQEINRSYAALYSLLSGATLSTITNPQGRLREATKRMMEILR